MLKKLLLIGVGDQKHVEITGVDPWRLTHFCIQISWRRLQPVGKGCGCRHQARLHRITE